ncbi:desmoplakin [Cryptophlebia peltastica nucleopolyhedrovirus]|uniref:Desmoplakin n=1 Tax=Cryptophlebia peltastica nucleopolyhedrovirus TaxID=2304025 RepID=A0A346RNS6_9ABAC|nr:desmoplakin [Cryptophlebia peltastica nucleopolyhedrovirus]AXS67723.1 desmoplakin [Cryptophlebia peltastica nucleopolyhedrovirus]
MSYLQFNKDPTTKALLKTISALNRRCQAQGSNDEMLERVRSIICQHRPHLQMRLDLQIPELVQEALIPITFPNQITHNYNYKYDYNSNYNQGGMDAFGSPQPPQQMMPPQQNMPPQNYNNQQQLPVQNNYTRPIALDEREESELSNALTNNLTPNVNNFTIFINLLKNINVKYFVSSNLVLVFEKLKQFYDSCSQPIGNNVNTNKDDDNDIQALLRCIKNKTDIIMPLGPDLCPFIVLLLNSFKSIALKFDKKFIFTSLQSDIIKITESTTSALTELENYRNKKPDEDYKSKYDQLKKDYTKLQTQIVPMGSNNLQIKYNSLKSSYDQLTKNYNTLESNNTKLQIKNDSLERENNDLKLNKLNQSIKETTTSSINDMLVVNQKDKINTFEHDITRLKQKHKSDLQMKELELKSKEQKIDNLNQQITSLNQQISSKEISLFKFDKTSQLTTSYNQMLYNLRYILITYFNIPLENIQESNLFPILMKNIATMTNQHRVLSEQLREIEANRENLVIESSEDRSTDMRAIEMAYTPPALPSIPNNYNEEINSLKFENEELKAINRKLNSEVEHANRIRRDDNYPVTDPNVFVDPTNSFNFAVVPVPTGVQNAEMQSSKDQDIVRLQHEIENLGYKIDILSDQLPLSPANISSLNAQSEQHDRNKLEQTIKENLEYKNFINDNINLIKQQQQELINEFEPIKDTAYDTITTFNKIYKEVETYSRTRAYRKLKTNPANVPVE